MSEKIYIRDSRNVIEVKHRRELSEKCMHHNVNPESTNKIDDN